MIKKYIKLWKIRAFRKIGNTLYIHISVWERGSWHLILNMTVYQIYTSVMLKGGLSEFLLNRGKIKVTFSINGGK